MKSFLLALLCSAALARADHALVLQTDFGTKDGDVAALKGVAFQVSPRLPIFDLSHENTPFDIWQGAYRLKQAAPYWPAGTVFVSVIDPGVGTARKVVVLQTKNGLYFVSPDNGTLTLVADELGIAAVREIDAAKNPRPSADPADTFPGRDVYAYVGARLAAGVITFEEVGPLLAPQVVRLSYEKPERAGDALLGNIPALDTQFGNVWTNLDQAFFAQLSPQIGERFRVTIERGGQAVYTGEMPYVKTYAHVPAGTPLLYVNSLMQVSFALNLGNFATANHIGSGAEWTVRIERVRP